ncbi:MULTISPECIES: hypothetical protein [unclassified Microcoleus]|uniref:hypothetical protein n=1 Tax=unclassified Microcoleus TaxID=2642155 RepID=UPI002FD5239F
MTTELSTKLRPDEICEKLGIGTSTYYNRLKYLGIEASRDAEGPYLNAEQMKLMEELSEHIKATGKMQGFGGGGQLALSESSGLASALEIPVQPEIPGSEEDEDGLEELIREAAELKVQQVAMPELIKLHLAAGMTEDDLPPDLKAKLQAVRDAANPKPNAAASLAQRMLQRHRQNQGKNPETK